MAITKNEANIKHTSKGLSVSKNHDYRQMKHILTHQ